ncbi:sigma factor-like helix-turn-helix DNA-binding protein [Nostocoides sp.]
MLVVLETLSPDERLAFVLHDMFDLPFDQIAQVLGKSSDTSRQLASRARRKVRGQDLDAPDVEGDRRVVQAYLDAIKAGDLPTLVALLHPDVELTADAQAMSNGRPNHLVGVAKVSMGALYSADRAAVSEVALIDGRPGLVMAPGGQLAILLTFVIVEGQITRIDVVADPERLAAATIAV